MQFILSPPLVGGMGIAPSYPVVHAQERRPPPIPLPPLPHPPLPPPTPSTPIPVPVVDAPHPRLQGSHSARLIIEVRPG